MPETARPRIRWLLMILLVALLGCDEDKRLVALSRESLERQAEQNQQMARQTETVAKATQQLVEAESESRRQSQELHQQLHAERQSVDRQHEDLEKERQRVAAERRREPIIAETISGIVGLLVAALPLVVCWYLVRTLFLSAHDDVTAAELVIEQLATQDRCFQRVHNLCCLVLRGLLNFGFRPQSRNKAMCKSWWCSKERTTSSS